MSDTSALTTAGSFCATNSCPSLSPSSDPAAHAETSHMLRPIISAAQKVRCVIRGTRRISSIPCMHSASIRSSTWMSCDSKNKHKQAEGLAVTEELSSPMEASSSCASAVRVLLGTASFPGFAAATPAIVAALLALSVWPPAFEAAPGARLPGWAVAPLPDMAAGLLPGRARWASSLDQMLPARLGCISCRNSASWGSSAWQVRSMKVLRIVIPQTFAGKTALR